MSQARPESLRCSQTAHARRIAPYRPNSRLVRLTGHLRTGTDFSGFRVYQAVAR
jgi:hypothetical protein